MDLIVSSRSITHSGIKDAVKWAYPWLKVGLSTANLWLTRGMSLSLRWCFMTCVSYLFGLRLEGFGYRGQRMTTEDH